MRSGKDLTKELNDLENLQKVQSISEELAKLGAEIIRLRSNSDELAQEDLNKQLTAAEEKLRNAAVELSKLAEASDETTKARITDELLPLVAKNNESIAQMRGQAEAEESESYMNWDDEPSDDGAEKEVNAEPEFDVRKMAPPPVMPTDAPVAEPAPIPEELVDKAGLRPEEESDESWDPTTEEDDAEEELGESKVAAGAPPPLKKESAAPDHESWDLSSEGGDAVPPPPPPKKESEPVADADRVWAEAAYQKFVDRVNDDGADKNKALHDLLIEATNKDKAIKHLKQEYIRDKDHAEESTNRIFSEYTKANSGEELPGALFGITINADTKDEIANQNNTRLAGEPDLDPPPPPGPDLEAEANERRKSIGAEAFKELARNLHVDKHAQYNRYQRYLRTQKVKVLCNTESCMQKALMSHTQQYQRILKKLLA